MILPAFLFGTVIHKATDQQTAAALWLDEQAARFLDFDSANLSAAQLRVIRELASKVVSRAYAEEWMLSKGITPPPYNSPEWHRQHEAYLQSDD